MPKQIYSSEYYMRGTSYINRISGLHWLQEVIWHATLLATTSIQTCYNIKNLHEKAISAFCLNGCTWEWFRIIASVRQVRLLSSTLVNIFLERIIANAFDDHKVIISFGGWTISKLLIAADLLTGTLWSVMTRFLKQMACRSVQEKSIDY